MKKVLPNEG
ncbi:Protein of unknown function [Bacillus thuringiensis]|uniref:Uncharacterized protein n=1 Tax=Bacillus thuringiensis TaxID=1428 RepID=A0A1C3YWW9_BACTU|nr:Protein of unknown function [Bacillus thuringiensis]